MRHRQAGIQATRGLRDRLQLATRLPPAHDYGASTGLRIIKRDLLPLVRRAVGKRYAVEREIARGGAARVFLATDETGTRMAVKVLHPELAVSVAAERFVREIEFLKTLDHPNIARLLDSGEHDFIVYYVMPYVDGPSLQDHLRRARRLSIDDTLRVANDLLDALGYAHQRGIVHRDVKPDNIVLARSGPVLVDFGIARAVAAAGTSRLTRSGFAVGTSSYMSPEQVQGIADIDRRSDLYSLGCVLYECLTGRAAFRAPQEESVLRLHLDGRFESLGAIRPDLRPGFVAAIERAMACDRNERWPDAATMREGLEAVR